MCGPQIRPYLSIITANPATTDLTPAQNRKKLPRIPIVKFRHLKSLPPNQIGYLTRSISTLPSDGHVMTAPQRIKCGKIDHQKSTGSQDAMKFPHRLVFIHIPVIQHIKAGDTVEAFVIKRQLPNRGQCHVLQSSISRVPDRQR